MLLAGLLVARGALTGCLDWVGVGRSDSGTSILEWLAILFSVVLQAGKKPYEYATGELRRILRQSWVCMDGDLMC